MLRRPDLFARFDESQLSTKAEKKILQQAREEVWEKSSSDKPES
jgi:tRNA (guanine37-N1)-methyltransferase